MNYVSKNIIGCMYLGMFVGYGVCVITKKTYEKCVQVKEKIQFNKKLKDLEAEIISDVLVKYS